jgi:hypothetical protein
MRWDSATSQRWKLQHKKNRAKQLRKFGESNYDWWKNRGVGRVEVGMALTGHPPHRSGLAELPHPVPVSGRNV